MIDSLRGKLLKKSATLLVVECGGIGYAVHTPLKVVEGISEEVGDEISLLTEFLVREDSQTLYGFRKEYERELFRQLIKISGVGARMILAAMSAMSAEELINVLAAEDVARLTQIPGVGTKTADLLVVSFRGKPLLRHAAATSNVDAEVEQALESLGYKKTEIKKVLAKLEATEGSTEDRVRAALRLLSPGR